MRRQLLSDRLDRLDLTGRSLLFVGGLKQQLPHMRRYVEQYHGRFAHHDGGMEDNINRLAKLFGRADCVLFPVDCVSHAAQTEIKRLCRRWDKPFIALPGASISVFKQALQLLGPGSVAPAQKEAPTASAWPPTDSFPDLLSSP